MAFPQAIAGRLADHRQDEKGAGKAATGAGGRR